MNKTAQEIADMVNGTIEGNPNVEVSRPARIEEAQKGEITFLANPKYESYIYTSQASAVLLSKSHSLKEEVKATLIRVDNVYHALAILNEQFIYTYQKEQKISDLAFVHDTAIIGESCCIDPFCYVGQNVQIGSNCTIHPHAWIDDNVVIGDHCIIYAGVRIYQGCEIGKRTTIHANAVIGSDGFGFARKEDGTFSKIDQLGNVKIGDEVEIGANVTIDRASLGSTTIDSGTKLDNLIHIAHNVSIGENTAIAAQAGIAGSTRIGSGVLIGGQAGIVGHIEIGNGTMIQAQSGVSKNTQTNAKIYGSPAIPYNNYLRSYAVFQNLPDLRKQIIAMQREIDKLKSDKV